MQGPCVNRICLILEWNDQIAKIIQIFAQTTPTMFFFFEKEKQSRLIFLDVSQLFHRSFGSRKTRCHLLLLLPKAQRGWFVVRNVACLGRIGISATQPTCVEKRQKFAFWAGWFMILKSETGHGSYCYWVWVVIPQILWKTVIGIAEVSTWRSHNFVLLLELIGLCSQDLFFLCSDISFKGASTKKFPLNLRTTVKLGGCSDSHGWLMVCPSNVGLALVKG